MAEQHEFGQNLNIRIKPLDLEVFRHGAKLDGSANFSQWVRDALQRTAKDAAFEMLAESVE